MISFNDLKFYLLSQQLSWENTLTIFLSIKRISREYNQLKLGTFRLLFYCSIIKSNNNTKQIPRTIGSMRLMYDFWRNDDTRQQPAITYVIRTRVHDSIVSKCASRCLSAANLAFCCRKVDDILGCGWKHGVYLSVYSLWCVWLTDRYTHSCALPQINE